MAIREPVLNAATVHTAADEQSESDGEDDRGDDPSDAASAPVTDGSGATDTSGDERDTTELGRPDDCDCPDGPVGFPCWPCVRDGYRALPDDDRGDPTGD